MTEDRIPPKELEKKRILSTLDHSHELYGDMSNVKLYSSDKEGKNWLFSDVEGYLCLILDYEAKTIYIRIYDIFTYQILFQYELYNNFAKLFEELASDFLCFEIDSGFLGIQFDSEDEAQSFYAVIKRLSGLKADLLSKSKPKEDIKQNITKVASYVKELKSKFNTGKYDENYAGDGMEILKFDNFQIMNNISYDKEKRQFKFGNISEGLKEMFRSFGIKKKDLERDASYAFTILSIIIVGLGNENNKVKNIAIENIEHFFPPPEERERIRKKEAATEAMMIGIKQNRKPKQQKTKANEKTVPNKQSKTPQQTNNKVIQNNTPKPPENPKITPMNNKPLPSQTPKPVQKIKPVNVPAPKINKPISQPEEKRVVEEVPVPQSVPEEVPDMTDYVPPPPPSLDIPEVPLPPPNVPNAVPLSECSEEKNEEEDTGVSFMEKELAKVKLKKVVKTEKDKVMTNDKKNFLVDAISQAIKIRSQYIHMHDDDEEDQEDDWD